MLKEPLLFCAIGGMSCKAHGLRVFWFKQENGSTYLILIKFSTACRFAAENSFAPHGIVFFGRMCYTNDVRKTVCRKAALHQEKER